MKTRHGWAIVDRVTNEIVVAVLGTNRKYLEICDTRKTARGYIKNAYNTKNYRIEKVRIYDPIFKHR